MEKLKYLFDRRRQLYSLLCQSEELLAAVYQIGQKMKSVIREGTTILVCGNGGSAAEAQHLAGELVGRYLYERDGLPALSLTADTSILTAVSNDFGYDEVFARQVTAYQKAAGLIILLSTSGNSENLIKAALRAKSYGITTIGLLGKDGGALKDLCDFTVIIPSRSIAEIQEAHLVIIHLLCEYIDGDYR